MADDNSTVPSQRKGRRCSRNRHRRRKKKQPAAVVDSISSLPDDILQHILSFIPTKYAITTSVLSKRWRYVWCDTPSLSFNRYHYPPDYILKPAYINDTLNRYTALKMMRFHFDASKDSIDYIDKWIKFAMSRNVENLSVYIPLNNGVVFELPDFFYNNSSLKQLSLDWYPPYIIPTCSVSWTSLKNLSLHWCKLSNESIDKILSGCPILESLTLFKCRKLSFLDLSKYPNLTTLRVSYCRISPGPTEIVAPHIHSLKLKTSDLPCTSLDVSSLTEAKLNIWYFYENIIAYIPQVKMLEILQNVEKLTLGERFLKIFSLAEIRGDHFPMFKVKALTLKTSISQYVIHGIERMLQNSPDLKKITLHIKSPRDVIWEREQLDAYVRNLTDPDQCRRSKNGFVCKNDPYGSWAENVIPFIERVLENAEALEKLVVLFRDPCYKFKKLVPKLSNKNNVSIVLSTKSY